MGKRRMSHWMVGVLLLCLVQSSLGASVILGVSNTAVTITNRIGEARYRLSQTNWDQMLGNGAVPITSADIATSGLGNAASLNGVEWDFAIAYENGDSGDEGFTFVMNEVGGGRSGILSYDVTDPLNGLTPTGAFNGIKIEIRAGALRDTSDSYTETASIALTGLVFDIPLPSSGALEDPMSAFTPPGSSGARETWIIADTDLSAFDWTLSGRLQASFDCDGLGGTDCLRDESLKMNLKFAEVAAVPLPAAGWLFGSALLGLAGLSRRRSIRREGMGAVKARKRGAV